MVISVESVMGMFVLLVESVVRKLVESVVGMLMMVVESLVVMLVKSVVGVLGMLMESVVEVLVEAAEVMSLEIISVTMVVVATLYPRFLFE